jgi:hypothetical protein
MPRGRDWSNGRIELAKGDAVEADAVRKRVRAPDRYCDDDVAFRLAGVVRGDHPRNRFTGHDIADLKQPAYDFLSSTRPRTYRSSDRYLTASREFDRLVVPV